MADNSVTLALEGDVSFHHYRETLNHFYNLIDLLSREVAPDTAIEWIVEGLQSGSAITTIAGYAQEEAPVLRVVKSYSEIGIKLQRGEPIPFTPQIVREAQSITRVIDAKVTAVRFETFESDSIIYSALDEQRRTQALKYISYGMVKGRVQALNNRGNLRFTLYDSVLDSPINCYLKAEQEELMREIWGKEVAVLGRVTRNPDSGQPVNVKDVTAIERLSMLTPGSWRATRGIFAWTEEDEPAEVSVRRLRDA